MICSAAKLRARRFHLGLGPKKQFGIKKGQKGWCNRRRKSIIAAELSLGICITVSKHYVKKNKAYFDEFQYLCFFLARDFHTQEAWLIIKDV